jgi:oligopeptide/dipeptide ABC transporter ATP-binding protein
MTANAARRERIIVGGDVPSPIDPPHACVFHPRCPRAHPGHCDVEEPHLAPVAGEPSHAASCHYPLERWPMTEQELRHGVTEAPVATDAE